MRKTILTLLICSLSTSSQADLFTAKYHDCYDGDTCTVDLLHNETKGYAVPHFFGQRVKIRFSGIDTAEIRGKCIKEKILAKAAKEFTKKQLANAKKIFIDTDKVDSFGRYVGVIYADNRINSVNQMLLNNDMAVVEKKGYNDWCN
tara:strand:+ start:359 stop:796 length:438 start_codon:yes stop_codon:yes gene_type:complete